MCLTKITQEIVAKYKLPDVKHKLPGQVHKHGLKPRTWDQVHSQITFKSNPKNQTEGLLTSHCSVLQLPILNIDHYPIQTVQTITHIIVYFVPQTTIIAIIVYTI
jgi:hypothetical protein